MQQDEQTRAELQEGDTSCPPRTLLYAWLLQQWRHLCTPVQTEASTYSQAVEPAQKFFNMCVTAAGRHTCTELAQAVLIG